MKKFKIATAILYWLIFLSGIVILVMEHTDNITPEHAKLVALIILAIWLFAKYFILTAKIKYVRKHWESYDNTTNGE